MLVNVVYTEVANLQFDGVVDYKTLTTDEYVICAVIVKPVTTRTQRNSILYEVGKTLLEVSGKDVYVSADLDIFCCLGRNNIDTDTIVRELVQRGTISITAHS